MNVRVDDDRCVGHGMCRIVCPEVFLPNDDDGHSYVLQEKVPAEHEDAVEQAVHSCPEQAIEIWS